MSSLACPIGVRFHHEESGTVVGHVDAKTASTAVIISARLLYADKVIDQWIPSWCLDLIIFPGDIAHFIYNVWIWRHWGVDVRTAYAKPNVEDHHPLNIAVSSTGLIDFISIEDAETLAILRTGGYAPSANLTTPSYVIQQGRNNK